MKWIWSVGLCVLAASSLGAGQVVAGEGPETMGRMTSMTYVGCVEAGTKSGTFVLTHVSSARTSGAGSMRHGSMEGEAMVDEDTGVHAMSPETLALAGSPDLRKHVGYRVTVTGPVATEMTDAMGHDMSTLTVKSLKVTAKSCW